MPQLHFYLPESLAVRIRQRARARGVSVSRYVAEIMRNEVGDEWPEGYFEEVVGGWKGELERPGQGEPEERDEL
jgi:hypothetical protein